MTNQPTVDQENVSATLTVAVPAARVFAVLADRGIVKTCGSAARLFFSPAVSLTTLTFATVLAVVNPRRVRRTPGVQRR